MKLQSLFLLALALVFSCVAATAAEPWKGRSSPSDFKFGIMGGAGIQNSSVGFVLLPFLSMKVVDRGFAGDIDDQVFFEIQAGPYSLSGSTGAFYSAHLRWDFHRNETYALYALGGVGGSIFSVPAFSSSSGFRIFPRFGIGGLMKLADLIALRVELSHEFMGIGAQFAL